MKTYSSSAAFSLGFLTLSLSASAMIGTDDRQNLSEVKDAKIRKAAQSVAMMLPSYRAKLSGRSATLSRWSFREHVTKSAKDYGFPRKRACSGPEFGKFGDEPSIGWCSGALIAPDLILTAAHCVEDLDCKDASWVFGYDDRTILDSSSARVAAEDVHHCAEIVTSVFTVEEDGLDATIVRLDRPSRRKPLEIDLKKVKDSQPTTVIGYPFGLPEKVSPGGRVQGFAKGTFTINNDLQPANSGSPVFNTSTMKVIGVFAGLSYESPYEFLEDLACLSQRTGEPNRPHNQPEATRLDLLPEAFWESINN